MEFSHFCPLEDVRPHKLSKDCWCKPVLEDDPDVCEAAFGQGAGPTWMHRAFEELDQEEQLELAR